MHSSINFLGDGMVKMTPAIIESKEVTIYSKDLSIGIFAANTESGSKDYSAVRVYECKISKGNEIIMDLIPVRVGDAGYLYDTISKTLLGDDVHPLIAGPDVK